MTMVGIVAPHLANSVGMKDMTKLIRKYRHMTKEEWEKAGLPDPFEEMRAGAVPRSTVLGYDPYLIAVDEEKEDNDNGFY